MERLHILDGHGYLFRAFYALYNQGGGRSVRLTTATGMPTGALRVYASMLLRLYLDENPDRIVVVFDAPGKSFRFELDDQYKANRREKPEDLKVQMPYFQPITEAFSWPVVSVTGVEADDVIATMVHRARARDWDVTIYSADKDMMQLVDDHVVVIDAMRQITYDRDRVVEKFGVPPAQVRDWLALVGDTSDNIPGMAGVGAKTAAALLEQFGSIDHLLARTGELKGKLRERFEDPAQLERLALSRRLVELVTDVELGVELDSLRRGPWDGTRLREIFRELEFEALLDQLGNEAKVPDEPAPARLPSRPPAAAITAPEGLAALTADIRAAGRVAVCVETDDQRPERAALVGVAFAVAGRPPAYVPVGHRYLGAPQQLPVEQLAAVLGPVLADPSIEVVAHDVKAAHAALGRVGITLANVACDTMLAAYLLDASVEDVSATRVVKLATGELLPARTEIVGKGKKARGFDEIAVESATEFVGTAAGALLDAAAALVPRLDAAGQTALAREVELPLARLLARLEQTGIAVDVERLRALSDRVSGEIAAIERAVYEIAGEPINLGSPKQLSVLLFGKLGLTSARMKKTKTGMSTDAEVLEAMRDEHPIIAPILEHRELIKLKGTYIDALPPLVHAETGRIHCQFRQAVAATGRLSASDPNLQNIPIRTELGREIRRAFVAPPGRKLVSCDYSQIELRLMAHFSGDPVLVTAFSSDVDVHTQTAAEVFGMPLSEVGPEQRRIAKAVNYGLIYGQSGFGLSRAVGISRDEARTYIERYFERLSGVQRYLDEVIAQARQEGVSRTILGRLRPIPDLSSRNFQARSAAERIARNTPLQGSGADIIKLAMLRAQSVLDNDFHDAKMLLTVHDELVFEVAAERAAELGVRMKREMESVYPLTVPLRVDVGVADDWAGAH